MSTDDNSALIIRPDQKEWTEAQLRVIKEKTRDKNGNITLGDNDPILTEFLHKCQRTKLDPFSSQIYLVPRQGKFSIQTGIDGYRIIAQRTGEYAGQEGPFWCGRNRVFHDVWLESTPPAAAKVGVYRKGFIKPVFGVATWDSYAPISKYNNQPSGLWGKMPDVMIAKCAEALGLRKAFPDDLAGIYTAEEMAQADMRESMNEEVTPIQISEERRQAATAAVRARVQEIADRKDVSADEAARLRTELLGLYERIQAQGIDTERFDEAMTMMEAVKHYGAKMKEASERQSVTVSAPDYEWRSLDDQTPLSQWEQTVDTVTSEQELLDLESHAKRHRVLGAIAGHITQAREDLKAPDLSGLSDEQVAADFRATLQPALRELDSAVPGRGDEW